MPPLTVQIKHAGQTHSLDLNTDLPPGMFKEAVSAVTGVPVDRVKVMVKGGVLKDDSDWKKIGPKAGQTFMVIGTATELPRPPSKPVVFLEDLGDQELAQTLVATPAGLNNLGNTCYMNATVQAMRAIPELQQALQQAQPSSPLPDALRNLYTSMSHTTSSFTPMSFLSILRQVAPQFAEVDRSGRKGPGAMGFAQQDAEECWSALINAVKDVPGLPGPSAAGSGNGSTKKFVEQYMMGLMRRELTCIEAPDEAPVVVTENVLKIECNIGSTTNYMLQGITNSLTQEVEKYSPSLDRQALYTQKSRLSRLPTYLTVHMVRFAWRRDIGRKAKIMRRVKFPEEFDALDLCTDELKKKLEPVNRKLGDVTRSRQTRRAVAKRSKVVPSSVDVTGTIASGSSDASAPQETASGVGSATAVEPMDEDTLRQSERQELEGLVDAELKKDIGCSVHGLYELVAIVTHKGAAADAGHYIGFVKKSVFQSTSDASSSVGALNEDDQDWYKFDDDKVTVFPREKLSTLDGGGEDSSAYVLLYKSRPIV